MKLLIFDMDGVLVDPTESYRGALMDTVEHFAGVRPEHDEIVGRAFALVRSELIGLPARITHKPALRAEIELHIDAMLNRCSKRLARGSRELAETGQIALPPKEEESKR